ncbi:MAG TPA: putative Ig domain-containing protein, partial [Verrucomicrobiae bacterium]|nr:putative Ig domain-containing protein [Verrucomicrobiae bacterium]
EGPAGEKNAPKNLRIGALQTLVGGSFLTGAIDDVQIFDRVFGSEEVALLMNHAPGLAPVFDTSILAGRTLLITNTATDADLPAQSLAFGIQDAPAGVAINSSTGVLTWRPAISESGAAHSITVRVNDNGAPTMSATQRFAVAVQRPEKPAISMLAFNQGNFSMNVIGDSGPDYIVEASTNLGSAADWIPLATNYSAAPPFLWKDTQSARLSRRFYRIRLGP